MSDISKEPLQNRVAADVGSSKAWKNVYTDDYGNTLLAEAISWEKRWDYDTRTDGQPVYVGYSVSGTATSSALWIIQKFTYSTIGGYDFVTRRQVAKGSWDGRVALFA